MKYILLTITAILLHQVLLKVTPYRWLVNCLTFPWNYFKLKRKLRRSTNTEVVDLYFLWDNTDYWFSKQWFGKVLKKVIEAEVLKRDK